MFYFPNKVVFAVPADEKQEKKNTNFVCIAMVVSSTFGL